MMFSLLVWLFAERDGFGRNGAALLNVEPYVNTSSVKKIRKGSPETGCFFVARKKARDGKI